MSLSRSLISRTSNSQFSRSSLIVNIIYIHTLNDVSRMNTIKQSLWYSMHIEMWLDIDIQECFWRFVIVFYNSEYYISILISYYIVIHNRDDPVSGDKSFQ